MTEKQYGALVARMAPKSPMWRDCLNAFWIGGLICVVGQIFTNCYGAWGTGKAGRRNGRVHDAGGAVRT